MRILTAILSVGLFAVPSAAKLKVGIDVDAPDDRIKSGLKAGIAARFNSTERYSVTESAMDSDIVMNVMCVPVRAKNAGHDLGIACASDSSYYPFKNTALCLHVPGASSIVTGNAENLQNVINGFVDDLINASTDEKLADYKKTITDSVQLLCSSKPRICQQLPSK